MSTIDSDQSFGKLIGQYVAYQRNKAGFSIYDYAKKCDLNQSFIFRLEKGAYKTIKLDVVAKLAIGFKMSVQSFLFKCGIISTSETLPSLEYYLKEKYQFSPEIVDEVRSYISFIHYKHDEKIHWLKEKHKDYWHKSQAAQTLNEPKKE